MGYNLVSFRIRVSILEFPLFNNPAQYLKKRDGKFTLKTFFKRRFEYKAIDSALSGITDINSVYDIPCGPGRLFSKWKSKKWAVTGMDLSEEMISAARDTHLQLDLVGDIYLNNVFEPKDPLADLVASVRFVYYFEKTKRIELLKCLAQLSNRFLLIQYKTVETRKGKNNSLKSLNSNSAYVKYHCSNTEISQEIRDAGLKLIRIVSISHASDRVFVMAEK